MEQLDAAAPLPILLPTPATLQRQLRSTGELRLAHLGAPDEQWGDLLAHTLSLDSTQRVRLSGAAVEAWRAALEQRGVRSGRLQTGVVEDAGLRLELLR